MTFPQGPPQTKSDRVRVPVFAIGRRVLARGVGPTGSVTLTDDAGTVLDATLRKDTEVAIIAWRPSGEATRYRVRAVNSGLEGWLGVDSIRGKPAAPVAPRAPSAAPVAKAAAAPTRQARRPVLAKARSSR